MTLEQSAAEEGNYTCTFPTTCRPSQTMVPPFADVASEKHRIAGRSTTDILSAAVELIEGPQGFALGFRLRLFAAGFVGPQTYCSLKIRRCTAV